jgi:hypothetical protein
MEGRPMNEQSADDTYRILHLFADTGVDVRHEVRSDDPPIPDEWNELEVYEARQHGVRKVDAGTEVLRT